MLTCLSLQAQVIIDELTIDFDDSQKALVKQLTGDGDCDSNPGIFGIQDGAFVINDMEGATCCTNSPLQGWNDNRALLGPVIALTPYCDVRVTIDVSLSATDFESCLSKDLNPVGCTAFVPTYDPGGDGFLLETMMNGINILKSGYCGEQRRGIFTSNLGDIEIGDVFTFLITGGTQDEAEVYSINSIEFIGYQRSLIPAMIAAIDTVLCEGLDPLILTEISGGKGYSWSKDGVALANSSSTYNTSGVVELSDAGRYSVTVTDDGGCISVDEMNIEILPLSSKGADPTFSNLPLTYCVGDTIMLPLRSDDGSSGSWNIELPFIITSPDALDSIVFTPDDLLFNPVGFPIVIQDYIRAMYVDTICAGISLILGAEVFDSSRLMGTYIIDGGTNSCDTLYSVMLALAKVDTTLFNQTVCPGDTFDIGGELFHYGRREGGVLVLEDDLCLNYVIVTLSADVIEVSIEYNPCTDDPIFDNIDLRRDTSYTISGNGVICDSIINISYLPSPTSDSILTFTLCPDDSIVFENQVFDIDHAVDTFVIYNAIGCPRNQIVSLEFIEEVIIPYEVANVCFGDTVQVEDELFYFGKESGLVRKGGIGCDTLLDVNVIINRALEEFINIDPCISFDNFRGHIISRDTSIVAVGSGNECDTIFHFIYSPSFLPDSLLQLTICDQDTVIIEGVRYHASNTSGRFQLIESNQCRRDVIVDIQVESEIVTFLSETICEGTDILVGGEIFDIERPVGDVTFFNELTCDSIVRVELSFVQSMVIDSQIVICEGDTVNIRGLSFYSGSNAEQSISYGPNGCDTTLRVMAEYLVNSLFIIERTLCMGEVLTVGEEMFSPDRPSGQVVIPLDGGCDSVIDVRLTYFVTDTIEFNPVLCGEQSIVVGGVTFNSVSPSGLIVIPLENGCDSIVDVFVEYNDSDTTKYVENYCDGQSIEVGGVLYNSSNTSGTEVLVSNSGCDSIVQIALSYDSQITKEVEVILCPEEQIFIGSQSYDANNLRGTEYFVSMNGCDSIVEVVIILDTVEVSINSVGTCRQSNAGSIEVTVLSQGTFDISLAGETQAQTARSLIFEDLGIGDYSVVIESERSCFFVYDTEVAATFSNEVSYTITEGGMDHYDVIVDISGPFQNIIWEPSPDLSCIDCLNPTIRKGGEGSYKAVVQDLNGCIAVIEILTNEESQAFFYIPNVISLSGDPDNRAFYISASDEGVLSYDMVIFDRWGQPLFDKQQILPNDVNVGWQGKKSGLLVNAGVYVYSILIHLEDGTEERRTGEVLVVN